MFIMLIRAKIQAVLQNVSSVFSTNTTSSFFSFAFASSFYSLKPT